MSEEPPKSTPVLPVVVTPPMSPEYFEQRSLLVVGIVVGSISGLALIALLTLSICAIMQRNPGVEITTALVMILSALVGALTGILVNTKTPGIKTVIPPRPDPPLPPS